MIKILEVAESKTGGNLTPYEVVCMQECERMNELLLEIFTSLEELELGLAGALNMTDNMEALAKSLQLNRVPTAWGLYYMSKRPLASWYTDLDDRCQQLYAWTEEMILPKSVCISYLFNPMSFLTAIMQLTARREGLPLDDMDLETIPSFMKEDKDVKEFPADGAYIHGLFLEGAAWEYGAPGAEGYLIDQKLKELHPPMPVVLIRSVLRANKRVKAQYDCPTYYTTQRGPAYVFLANLNMESEDVEDSKWILSGTAMIMNEDF